MKKVKTFTELQNHPLVNEIWIENDLESDSYSNSYWLRLIEGKTIQGIGGQLHEQTKSKLINIFNVYQENIINE